MELEAPAAMPTKTRFITLYALSMELLGWSGMLLSYGHQAAPGLCLSRMIIQVSGAWAGHPYGNSPAKRIAVLQVAAAGRPSHPWHIAPLTQP